MSESENTQIYDLPYHGENTLTIEGKVWAIGLNWAPSADQVLKLSTARELTKNQNDNLFVVNDNRQLGTSKTDRNHNVGLPSLALAFADKPDVENLIGAYELDDGMYYVIAVINGLIVPTFDGAYSADDAGSMIFDLSSQHDFAERYGNPNIVYGRTTSTFIPEEINPNKTRAYRLKTTTKRATYIKLAAIAATFIVAWLGYNFYQKYELQQLQAESLKQQAIAAAEQARENELNQPIYPKPPSIGAVRAVDMIKTCALFMIHVPPVTPGWNETSMNCDGTSVTLTLARNRFGTINWLRPFIGTYKNPTITIDSSKIATVTWPLPKTQLPVWTNVKGPTPQQTRRYLVSQFSEADIPLDLGITTRPEINTKTIGNRPITVKALYDVTPLTIKQTPIIEDDMLDIISRLQNTVLDNVQLQLPDFSWKINITIFHTIKNPPIIPKQPAP